MTFSEIINKRTTQMHRRVVFIVTVTIILWVRNRMKYDVFIFTECLRINEDYNKNLKSKKRRRARKGPVT